jgi:SAM-dependent methyltransferase
MTGNRSPLAQLQFTCPSCTLASLEKGQEDLACCRCSFKAARADAYVDLLGTTTNPTDEHYTLQWGREKGFFDFLKKSPSVKSIMPAGQLGWPQLFEEIRARAATEAVWVYDAACGFGDIANELINEHTKTRLRYVGADIHHSLPDIVSELPFLEESGLLLRWDISKALPVHREFDYIICRAAIHHTPDPKATFQALVKKLKAGGRIAISAYRKKSMAREALDDRFRAHVVPLAAPEAYGLARQFTVLGKSLQSIAEKVHIAEDLPLFGISKGDYAVQTLIYNHFVKCFFNSAFGEEYSTLVNYDWYHPPFAFRYHLAELTAWFEACGLKVVRTSAIDAQYFVLGEK